MPRRAVVELLHLMAGLILTAAIFRGAAWAYPLGRNAIGWVGWATMLAVLLMGAPRVARAWRAAN